MSDQIANVNPAGVMRVENLSDNSAVVDPQRVYILAKIFNTNMNKVAIIQSNLFMMIWKE